MRYSYLLFFLCWSAAAFPQISRIEPQRPASGDRITLTYDTQNAKAVLNGNEAVYARITAYGQDGRIVKKHVLLTRQVPLFGGTYKLPRGTVSFKVEFYTLNKDDVRASYNGMVYTKGKERPVKGAYQEALFGNKPDSIFQLEVANYPNNYLAYAKYINVVSMVKDPDTARRQIRKLLTYLSKPGRDRDPGLFAALCIAHAKTGELAAGKRFLYELFDRYPATQETAFAFSIYNYEYYKASNKDVEEDVRQKLKAIFIAYPDAAISRDENVVHFLEKEAGLEAGHFEQVLLPRYADSTISYHGLTSLPEIYITKGMPEAAIPLLKKGIQMYQNGSINHQFRLSYGHYQMYVPILLMDLAKAELMLGHSQEAILASSAAISILSGSNTEGNFLPMLLPLRACAFELAGNYNLALEDHKKLYLLGNAGAVESIEKIFAHCNVKQATVSELLSSLRTPSNTTTKNAAPELKGFDLNGKPVKLSELKGKVVVVNIWGIGCGPCIAEMPELNKLTRRFPDRSKVVFLGISGDKTESLRKFLKTHDYNYTVLNKAGNLTEQLNTNALPVHIVVGKQGEIISRSVGARADIGEYLSGIIDRSM